MTIETTTTTVSPTLKKTTTSQLITLAGGCFWGVERVLRKHFTDKGLIDIKVGYANGIPTIDNINYKLVCTGTTNFVESVQISYEPSQLTVEDIIDIFFRMHDPTLLNAQGRNTGTQYRSAILTHSNEDLQVALELKDKYQKTWYPNDTIYTVIEPISIWYDAEDYHQEYLDKNPEGYACPTHFIRTQPKKST